MKSTKNYKLRTSFQKRSHFSFPLFSWSIFVCSFPWNVLSFFQHFCLFPFNFWDVGVVFFLLVSGLCLHVFLGTPSYRGTYMDRNLDEVFDSLPYSLLSTRVFLFCFGIFLEAWMWTVFFITWCFWKRPSVLICYSFYLCTAIDFLFSVCITEYVLFKYSRNWLTWHCFRGCILLFSISADVLELITWLPRATHL